MSIIPFQAELQKMAFVLAVDIWKTSLSRPAIFVNADYITIFVELLYFMIVK